MKFNVFSSKWSSEKALQSLIIWKVFWMLCVYYGWLSIEVSYKKILFCSFFCYCFRSTNVCFSQCISYSRIFRFEHIYKCNTWSILFGDMIKLNKCCVVEINNWKQKSGARLLTLTVSRDKIKRYFLFFFRGQFIQRIIFRICFSTNFIIRWHCFYWRKFRFFRNCCFRYW